MSDLTQLFDYGVNNGIAPDEAGPRAMGYLVTIPAGFIDIDLTVAQMTDRLDEIQTIFVDNADNATRIEITAGLGSARLVIPPNAQAYLPILIGDTGRVRFANSAGVTIRVQFLNVQVPSVVWKVT